MKDPFPIPAHALSLVQRLATTVPAPSSIWLIGSRANGRSNPDSDTDLLVFGSRVFMETVAGSIAKPEWTDVLVVHDGNQFEDIWSDKKGSLVSWNWKLLSETEATYEGGKFIPDTDLSEEVLQLVAENPHVKPGEFVEYKERAVRLWPQ